MVEGLDPTSSEPLASAASTAAVAVSSTAPRCGFTASTRERADCARLRSPSLVGLVRCPITCLERNQLYDEHLAWGHLTGIAA